MIRRYLPKDSEELIRWYERYIAPLALVVGFILDSFILLDRVDVLLGNVLLLSYLAIAGGGIVLLNVFESGGLRNALLARIAPFVPVVVQFAFGALFSGYLSLYSRSAGAAVSWIFVIALAALLLGNERFRTLYARPTFQVSIYFTALFSFLIFFLPLLFKVIGPQMFVLSGITSVCVIAAFLFLLRKLAPDRIKDSWVPIVRSLVAIFFAFHILYFSNLIPPLPLALKEAGVYSSVERIGSQYHLQSELQPWYVHSFNIPASVHLVRGEGLYVFSAVFAPSGLKTIIRHQWQRYDTSHDRWVTFSDVRFSIVGGRDGGFRGYSEKKDIAAGDWRVNVLTQHGQIIGRVAFQVIEAAVPPALHKDVR